MSPVIDLSRAPGAGEAWGRPRAVVYLWSACELVFVTNPWQISSRLRVAVLRAFGAEIADGVIFRPRTRVKAPWKLHIGERSWIGEGVWFHNQDHIHVGADVVISQETFLTTGSHRVRTDMGLVTSPIRIGDGAWITSRCMVLGGSVIGSSAVVQPMTVVKGEVGANRVFGSAAQPRELGNRFAADAAGSAGAAGYAGREAHDGGREPGYDDGGGESDAEPGLGGADGEGFDGWTHASCDEGVGPEGAGLDERGLDGDGPGEGDGDAGPGPDTDARLREWA